MRKLMRPGNASDVSVFRPSAATAKRALVNMLAAFALTLPMTGCNLGSLLPGGPSPQDIATAVGAPESQIHDVSCASAQTEPGYNCTFSWTTPQTGPGLFERGGTDTFTKRFVKTDAGAWRLVR